MKTLWGRMFIQPSFPVCNMIPVCYCSGFVLKRAVRYRTGMIKFMGTAETLDFETMGTLAAKAQQGDGDAYESLLNGLYPYVEMVLRIRIGFSPELDDLTQICVLAMHRSLPSYHPSRSLKPWVQAIIRYKLADYFRAQARRKEFTQTDEVIELAHHHASADEEDDVADRLNFEALLKQLPAEWATAVQLTKLDGMSCEEAAKKEGVSSGALRKRISRAYKRLAVLVEKELES